LYSHAITLARWPRREAVAGGRRNRTGGDRITPPESQLYEWRITKDNPKYGSAALYHAISDLMRNN
jgi:hypothetical protein